jgi:hypothetical protein
MSSDELSNVERSRPGSRARSLARSLGISVAAALAIAGSGTLASAAESPASKAEGSQLLKNGRIGYVMTERRWAVYQTKDGKTECPQGFNDGNREEFKKLFPDNGTKRTVVETQLKREGEQWHPETVRYSMPYKEAQGKISYGLNLDGKVDADDFESPEGEKGIDNQLYRVDGCTQGYRAGGAFEHFENLFMKQSEDSRVLIEISDVDDLRNDDQVTITTYRGLEALLTDASGDSFIPGGTQQIDMRWGKRFISSAPGKIVDGTLISDAMDKLLVPWGRGVSYQYQVFRGARFKLKLTPETAEGLLAGYADVDSYTLRRNEGWSTHHQSYGQFSSITQHQAMVRLADGYPDPKTGKNTAISSAMLVKFTQVFIQRPDKELMSQR